MNPEKSNTLKSMGNTGMKKDEIGISAKKYDRLFQKSEAIRLPHYFSSSTGERRQLQNLAKKFRTQEMTIACGCHSICHIRCGCQNNPRLYKKLITSICDSFMLQIKLAIVCLNRIFITIFSYFNQNP